MSYFYPLRIYQEIGYLFSKETIPSSAFIDHFSLSSYQYNSDINKIKELESEYGVVFNFDKKMISYTITDSILYNDSVRSLLSIFDQYNFQGKFHELALLQFQISEYLLLSDDFVQIDELAQQLSYSRSVIRKPLKLAREFINSFNIKIESTPHYGIRIVADEFLIRRCLATTYNWFKVDVTRRQNDSLTDHFKYRNYTKLITTLDTSLRQVQATLHQVERKKLRYYLIIQNRRIQEGKQITDLKLNDPQIEKIIRENRFITNVVSTLCKNLESELSFGPYNEQERFSIAVLLFTSGLDSELTLTSIKNFYPKEFDTLFALIMDTLLEYGINFNQKEWFLADYYSSEVALLYIKIRLRWISANGVRYTIRPPQIYDSPLIYQIALNLKSKLESLVHLPTNMTHILPFVEPLVYYLPTLKLHYPPLRIALISRISNISTSFFQHFILSTLPKEDIAELTCFVYDEIENNADLHLHYDLILYDIPTSNANQLAYLPYLDNARKLIEIHRDLCSESLFTNNGEIIVEPLCFDDLGWMEIIAKKCESSLECVKKAYDSASIHHKTLVILIINSSSPKKNLLQIGNCLRNKGAYDENIENYVLLAAHLTEENLYFYHLLLNELVNDTIFYHTLLSSPSKETINQQINAVVV